MLRRSMWIPAVTSAAALVAGLAGIFSSNDWKLLLVIPPSFAFTELLQGFGGVGTTLAKNPLFASRPGLPLLLDGFCRVAVAVFAFSVPQQLCVRFSVPPAGWNWYRICLLLGVVVMPWGYLVTSVRDGLSRWLMFVLTLVCAGGMILVPGRAGEVFAGLQLLLIVALSIMLWRLAGGKEGV